MENLKCLRLSPMKRISLIKRNQNVLIPLINNEIKRPSLRYNYLKSNRQSQDSTLHPKILPESERNSEYGFDKLEANKDEIQIKDQNKNIAQHDMKNESEAQREYNSCKKKCLDINKDDKSIHATEFKHVDKKHKIKVPKDQNNMLEDLLLLQLHQKYVSIYEKKLKNNIYKLLNNR